MFCPNCRAEYIEGITECPDCNMALVDELLPDEPNEPVDFVTVLSKGNAATLAVAKSILEGAGILFFAKGEGLQDLLGMGRLGVGFNIISGPVELQVDKEREDEAKELLAEIVEDTF